MPRSSQRRHDRMHMERRSPLRAFFSPCGLFQRTSPATGRPKSRRKNWLLAQCPKFSVLIAKWQGNHPDFEHNF